MVNALADEFHVLQAVVGIRCPTECQHGCATQKPPDMHLQPWKQRLPCSTAGKDSIPGDACSAGQASCWASGLKQQLSWMQEKATLLITADLWHQSSLCLHRSGQARQC